MTQQVRFRPQSRAITFEANQRVSEELSRGWIYRELAIRLEGQPTLTGVNNSAANTDPADEWGVVKKIEVIANGTDVIKSITGNALWWLNYFLFGRPPKITAGIGDGATANPAFDSLLILPFWYPNSIRPIDTALNSNELSSLEVAITWGQYTDVNSAATAWTAEPQVTIHSLESVGVKGPFTQWRIFPIKKEIQATNAEFQISLPIGKMYRGFLINTTDAGVDQGDILNRLKLVSGSTVFLDLKAGTNVLPQWQRLRSGNMEFFDNGAGAYDAFKRSSEGSIDGWYYIDLVTDGFMAEALDSLGFSELDLIMDVTVGGGTTFAEVYPMQLIPVRGGANG